MEVVGAYRIFERSNVRNVQYNEYYGDGDSKGYESVKNFYGINTVTKLECIGHVETRVGGRLRQLKKTTKGLGGKNKLTDKLIDRIQNYYGIAIRSNVGILSVIRNVNGSLPESVAQELLKFDKQRISTSLRHSLPIAKLSRKKKEKQLGKQKY
ncbi:uncharacterized protein LOC101238613 [Trichonephila clavipes]|nr:uncharacterized protein LOC101238613 [Trichonephila clavipes]